MLLLRRTQWIYAPTLTMRINGEQENKREPKPAENSMLRPTSKQGWEQRKKS